MKNKSENVDVDGIAVDSKDSKEEEERQELIQIQTKHTHLDIHFNKLFNSLFSNNHSIANIAYKQITKHSQNIKLSHKDISYYTLSLSSHKNHHNMLNAWGFVLLYYRDSLHRTKYLNALLSLPEHNFNSTKHQNRQAAFDAWKRLIINFSFGGSII